MFRFGKRRRKRGSWQGFKRPGQKGMPSLDALNARGAWSQHGSFWIELLGGFGVGRVVYGDHAYKVVTLFGVSRVMRVQQEKDRRDRSGSSKRWHKAGRVGGGNREGLSRFLKRGRSPVGRGGGGKL